MEQTPAPPLAKDHRVLGSLQILDRAGAESARVRAALHAQEAEAEQAIARAVGGLEGERQKAFDALKQRLALETLIRMREDQARKYASQLEQVRDAAAAAAMQHQQEALKGEISTLEDKALSFLEAEEAARARSAGIEKDVAALREEACVAAGERSRQLRSMEEEAARREEERLSLIGQLTPPTREQYQRLLSGHRVPAVTRANGGKCEGCQMALPPNLCGQARARKALAFCEHCGRILIWEGE